jgi:hypothetical protein
MVFSLDRQRLLRVRVYTVLRVDSKTAFESAPFGQRTVQMPATSSPRSSPHCESL